MNKAKIKKLLDYIDSTGQAMCTDDRQKLRKQTEAALNKITVTIKLNKPQDTL